MPQSGSKPRPLAALALVAAGAVGGLFLAPSPAVTADGDAAAAAVAALETRVRGLEDLLLTHISAENLTPPKEGGTILKAPFHIVDGSNQVIFSVVDDGGGIVQVVSPGGRSGVRLDGAKHRITTEGDGGIVSIGDTGKGWGLSVADSGGQPMADLAQPAGMGMALRIYGDGGARAAQFGTAPGLGGLLRLFGAGEKTAVRLDSHNDGTGEVYVAGKLGEEVGGIWIDGQKDVVRIKSDKGGAGLGGDELGWGLVLRDAGGNREASIGNPGGGMALRVYENSAEVAVVGNEQGAGGNVRIFSLSGKDAGASMFVNADGSGTVQASDGNDKGIVLNGQKQVVLVDADEGTARLGATDSGLGLILADSGGQPTADLTQPDGRGMALRIYNSGAPAAQIGVDPGTGGQVRLFASGERRTVGLDSNSDGTGKVQIGGVQGEDTGIILDGQKSRVVLDTDKGTATLGEGTEGWGLSIGDANGATLVDLTRPTGKGPGLRIYESGRPVAQLGLSPGRGGQLFLYENGTPAVWAGAGGDGGGRLQVYKAGVPAAGLMGVEGQVAVFSKSGTPVALLRMSQSGGGGTVEATDQGGQPVFRAGYLPSGPGGACVVHNGTKCLGIGLTGMEGFH